MLVSDFDYALPRELIAQQPTSRRDQSRLLILDRTAGGLVDAAFTEIGRWLCAGDLLVLNDTRVLPARIFGRLPTGGRLELLLLRRLGNGTWEALTRPSRKARPGTQVAFGTHRATVLRRLPEGMRIVRFEPPDVDRLLGDSGELALPPYVRMRQADPSRYQTVYARVDGAVAAPTAGLHFTPELLTELDAAGVEIVKLTLHASLGTFRPVKVQTVEEHEMHPEECSLPESSAHAVNRALDEDRRVVCVGTTTVRTLEGRARPTDRGWRVEPGSGRIDLYIYPGYEWKVSGALLTNFHLPRSTLLMLVCAFAGREPVLTAYRHAIAERYRFYSFGDAMLVV